METTPPNNNQGFFKSIKDMYGTAVMKDMKNFLNEKIALSKLINKQHFLLRCRKEKLYPKTRRLKNTFNINANIFNKLENNYIFGVINQEISETIGQVKTVKYNLDLLHHFIQEVLPSDVFQAFCDRVETTYSYHFNTVKVRHVTKFENIILDNLNEISDNLLYTNEKWLVNLSNVDLPLHVKFILSLGHKFCPPTIGNTVPYFKIISDVEGAIFNLDEGRRNSIRNSFVNILTNFKNNTRSNILTPVETRILSYVKQTKSFLKDNPNLMVSRADKGNITVLTTHSDYVQKIDSLLNDRSTYVPQNKDNSSSVQRRVNLLFKEWADCGKIDVVQKKNLTRHNTVIPKLYGLPKIHKPNVPYRPIVSSIDSPTYLLSSFVSDIIKLSVGKTDSFILNSEDFKEKIKNIILPPNFVLISLDVTSLFTNVDSKDVKKLISDNWRNIKNNAKTKLTKIQFLDALDLVLDNTEFSFNGKIYKQIFGTPMGSPVSPVLANFKMEHLENLVLSSLNFRPIFYYRFVDDIVTAVEQHKVNEFLEAFNAIDNRIKFTIELESENKLSFLDILLIHEPDGRISCDWFHKDTWSGRYLNFNSWLPINYKINTIKILTKKILKLSDKKFHYKNLKLLHNVLVDNHYPNSLIEKNIRQEIFRTTSTQISTPMDTETFSFLSIPYVKNLYERIKGLFKNNNFKVVARPATSLKNSLFSKIKDPIPLGKQSNLIYQVECSCNSLYTGQTKQFLEKRINQHVGDVTKDSDKYKISALTQHLKETKHMITLNNVKILDRQTNFKKRSILEMLHIKSSQNSLNIREDCEYIGNFYNFFT